MLTISLRSLATHKLRLALTVLAVMLGSAFVTGMLLLVGSFETTFNGIFAAGAQDVVVNPTTDSDEATVPGAPGPTLSQEQVDRVAALPEVATASGAVGAYGLAIIDSDGSVVGGFGPPVIGAGWQADPALAVRTITTGSAPTSADQIVVDALTFDNLAAAEGDTVEVVTPQGSLPFELVGAFRLGDTGGLAGASLVAFTLERAQELFLEPGTWHGIEVAVADGVSDEEAAEAIRSALGPAATVQTREEQVRSQSEAFAEGIGLVQTVNLAFAGIAFFVAAFLIFNTFAMLVAQRGREVALLRAIGATSRQVTRSILAEAFLVGLVSAAAGVGVGYLLALGLRGALTSLGVDLSGSLPLTPDVVLWAIGLGVAVTVVSAAVPALRAGRVRPVEAMREAAAPPERPGVLSSVVGGLILLVALAMLGYAIVAEQPSLPLTALFAVVLLLGAILLAPLFAAGWARMATPVARRIGGVAGGIAGRNAARSPRRAAATAAALMIGLALVTTFGILASSFQVSVNKLIAGTFSAAVIVAPNAPGATVGPDLAEQMRAVDGVEYAIADLAAPMRIADEERTVSAVGGGPITAALNLDPVSGVLDEVQPGSVLLAEDTAIELGVGIGDETTLTIPSGEVRTVQVVGTYVGEDLILADAYMSLDELRQADPTVREQTVYVSLLDGADVETVVSDLEQITADNPLLQVSDQSAIQEMNASLIDTMLGVVYAMLGLAIVVAALGVVNTMVLSVLERTREFGMLRAVGSAKRQVRRMVRWEAVLMTLLGAVIGVVAGLIAGVSLQQAMVREGITDLAVPWSTLAAVLLGAFVVGIIGAVLPARRAANLDILRAIATE